MDDTGSFIVIYISEGQNVISFWLNTTVSHELAVCRFLIITPRACYCIMFSAISFAVVRYFPISCPKILDRSKFGCLMLAWLGIFQLFVEQKNHTGFCLVVADDSAALRDQSSPVFFFAQRTKDSQR